MSDAPDENGGGKTLLIGLGAGVVLVAAVALFTHHRNPDGWNAGWLSGDTLIVEEYREDDGSEDERIVVLDLATGKRLATRDPDATVHAFTVVNGRIWLAGSREPGLEAWSAKDLKTVVEKSQLGIAYADSNRCSDGALARMMQRDGRYAVVDLTEAKVVPDRNVACGGTRGTASSSGQSSKGDLLSPREGDTERSTLSVGAVRLGGNETFLEPQYLFAAGGPVELDGDFFVVHRVELGQNRALKLSRVGEGAVRWTLPLGDPSSIEAVAFAPPSTLAIVGHAGITVLNAATGKALWRAGK